MIIFPQSFVLSTAGAGSPLDYPRIGWKNLARGLAATAVTVSGDTPGGPKDAPLRPDTAEFWQPPSLPATWTVDLGSAQTVEFVGIAAHTIGSCGAQVAIALDVASTLLPPRLALPGIAANYASTPDSALNSVTGDLELRGLLAATDYTPSSTQTIAAKWNPTGNQQSWSLDMTAAGNLVLRTTANGSTVRTATSSVATGVADGTTKGFKATRSASTGVVKFYTAPDYVPATGVGTWTQLGADVAGTIEGIFDSTAPVEIGSNSIGTAQLFIGNVYYFEVRSGIGGTVVSRFDPTEGPDNSLSWISGIGETWTVSQSGGTPAVHYNNNFSLAYSPSDDSPLMFLDTPRVGRYMRVTVTGAGAIPVLASIYVGPLLTMQKKILGGFSPLNLSRNTILNQALSRGGQFLGQSFQSNGVMGSISFQYLDPDWYRANFDLFSKSARSLPYFIAWDALGYPREIGYCWATKDIVPVYAADVNFGMSVNWQMQGIGAQ